MCVCLCEGVFVCVCVRERERVACAEVSGYVGDSGMCVCEKERHWEAERESLCKRENFLNVHQTLSMSTIQV